MRNKIIILIMLFCLVLNTICFAGVKFDYSLDVSDYKFSELDTNYKDYVYYVLDYFKNTRGSSVDYWCLIKAIRNSVTSYNIIASSEPLVADFSYNTNSIRFTIIDGCSFYRNSNSIDGRYYTDSNPYDCSYNTYTIIDSNHSIYDTEGEMVFPAPPLAPVMSVEVMTITENPEITTKMEKTLGTLVPIAIVVFSSLLVIYLIRLVILRVG